MEIDKIKKVMMGKASREEREEVESWAGGSAERKRFVEDARGFYAGEEIPDGNRTADAADLADDACVYMASQDDFPLGCCGGLCAFGGRDWLERMVAGYA